MKKKIKKTTVKIPAKKDPEKLTMTEVLEEDGWVVIDDQAYGNIKADVSEFFNLNKEESILLIHKKFRKKTAMRISDVRAEQLYENYVLPKVKEYKVGIIKTL